VILIELVMTEDIRIDIKPFDELTLKELHACLKLRGEVFVVGQRICAVADVDEFDPRCHHVMMRHADEVIGTARLLPLDDGKCIKVGRVAVAESRRGEGLGSSMMRALQDWIGQVSDRTGYMSAQADVQRWYEHLGWVRDGDDYLEAGIKHLDMRLPPDNTSYGSH